jgi:predicted ATPase/DNA-binding SARP family transcriptional activator/DNA-binding CsgD family transcriptional regulator
MNSPAVVEGVRRSEAVRIWLLGGFRVSVGSRTIPQGAWRLRKAAALVKLLALAPGHRMHREQAMDLLWRESGKKAASNNLRQLLYATKRTLTSDPAEGSRYLASEDESLVLCPEGDLWVDVDAFEEAAATARRARDPAAYRAAIELYAGELLPTERYEEWAESRRQQLLNTWLSLHLELARVYEGHGEYEKGIEVLQGALSEEPTNEQMHASLMRLYAFSDQREEALAQYQRLREALSGQVDVQVSATTERLREEIAAGGLLPAQPSVAPTEEPYDTTKLNLPASRTSFVGREHEMVEIKRHLAMTRLLTLTGAGGSGKTRLALEVARDLVGAYPDGVWLAELASLSQGEFVPRAVAEAVGAQEQSGRPITDTLVDALRNKKILLILDNCEQLADAVGGLVALLLDSCPRLRILATSRQALGAVGEVTWTVSLLSVPDLRSAPTVAQLEGYEAIRLFVDRARQRNPAFALRPENTQAVAQICVRLEGLPLAIELAAARIKMLPPQALLERLKDRLKLLTGGPRELSERQRTLRSTIEWSYALLDEVEQVLFGRLAVFSGGRTLQAIEAICDAQGDLPVDAFEGVSSLLDKSLIRQEEGPNGELRFVMLETIHEFAREKLEESSEAEQIKHAHAQYFLALAEKAVPELKGANQLEWLERLEIEHDNVRAALSWMLERGETELALQLGAAFSWFWEWRSYYAEGRRWLEEALRMDSQAPAATRANALAMAGNLAERQGDYDRSVELCEEGLELLRQTEEGGEAKLYLLLSLGNALDARGDSERARELFEEGLALSQEEGQEWFTGVFLHNLALSSSSQGDHERAIELLEQSAAIARRLGDQYLTAYYLMNLGNEYLSTEDHERAATLLEESLASFRVLGARGEVAWSLGSLGWAALLRKDFEQAETLFQESLALNRELGRKPYSASCLEDLACVASARGEAMRAAQLWGAAETLHQATGYPQDPIAQAEMEPYLASARSQIHETVWAKAWEEGQAMTLEEAISYALEEEEETDPLTTPAPEELSVGQAPVALTRREEEVAILVARQLSNRQIASELVLSEHTVATHLRNILKKLGLHSRTQIAGWSTQQRH